MPVTTHAEATTPWKPTGLTRRPYRARVAFSFEKLLVYQKTVAFADAVCGAPRRFPRGYF
jgi:hypothetical protein